MASAACAVIAGKTGEGGFQIRGNRAEITDKRIGMCDDRGRLALDRLQPCDGGLQCRERLFCAPDHRIVGQELTRTSFPLTDAFQNRLQPSP